MPIIVDNPGFAGESHGQVGATNKELSSVNTGWGTVFGDDSNGLPANSVPERLLIKITTPGGVSEGGAYQIKNIRLDYGTTQAWGSQYKSLWTTDFSGGGAPFLTMASGTTYVFQLNGSDDNTSNPGYGNTRWFLTTATASVQLQSTIAGSATSAARVNAFMSYVTFTHDDA